MVMGVRCSILALLLTSVVLLITRWSVVLLELSHQLRSEQAPGRGREPCLGKGSPDKTAWALCFFFFFLQMMILFFFLSVNSA